MAIIALKGLGKAFKKNTRGTSYKLEKAPAKPGQGKRALKAKERGLVPIRFLPCMVSGLAFYLAQKYKPELVQAMKLYYEDELARALAEDGSASSTHITPKAYYPGT